jgi:hypothetical protein
MSRGNMYINILTLQNLLLFSQYVNERLPELLMAKPCSLFKVLRLELHLCFFLDDTVHASKVLAKFILCSAPADFTG